MNSLYDSTTGAEFLLGEDGRYYNDGKGYEVSVGDKSPLGTGGTLVTAPPNTPTLPTQGASSISTTTGVQGSPYQEKVWHGKVATKMIEAAVGGRSPVALIDNLIKTTSPLQVAQHGVMDSFLELYAALPGDQQALLDPFLEKFDKDPLYTTEILMSEATRAQGLNSAVQQQLLNIVSRYNLSIPK
jgi:hypothetical protein